MKGKILWVVVNICRLAVSATFIFSGFIKLVDPHGTEYKIQDYLVALQLDSLMSVSLLPLILAVLLAVVEFCVGVYLLFSIRRRTTLSAILLMMLVYMPLTFWLAMSDAVSDCGCFGDVLHLTNWQTFEKNVVVFLMAILMWFQRRRLTRLISESAQWIVSLTALLGALVLSGYSLYYEPVIDFRPFHVGQHIPTAMQWPEDPEQVPEILDFTIEPLNDDTPIPDVEELLTEDSYTFLLTFPHLTTADDTNMDQFNALYDFAHQHGCRFLALTADGEKMVKRWCDLTGAEYDFAFMDELTLKTIARSNPALVLLHRGTIIGKWSHRQLPSEQQLEAIMAAEPLKKY